MAWPLPSPVATFLTVSPAPTPNTCACAHAAVPNGFLNIPGSLKVLYLSMCCSLCLECSLPLHSPASTHLTFTLTLTTQLWPNLLQQALLPPNPGQVPLPPWLCVSLVRP